MTTSRVIISPLEKVVFAQRVISFGSTNLANPLRFSLVTSSWQEAVIDYGAATLAWSKQIAPPSNMTPEQVQEEEEAEAKRLQDEKDKQEAEARGNTNRRGAFGWGGAAAGAPAITTVTAVTTMPTTTTTTTTANAEATAAAQPSIDSFVARKEKGKQFLIKLLTAGRGSLAAWALQQLRLVNYWSFLPLAKPEESKRTGGFGWGRRGWDNDDDDESAVNPPEHFEGALSKILLRGTWPEGAKALLLEKDSIPRDPHHKLLFKAVRSGNVGTVRLLLFDPEITDTLGDFKNPHVINEPYRQGVPVQFPLARAAEAGSVEIVHLLLENGAQLVVQQTPPPWMANPHPPLDQMTPGQRKSFDARVAAYKPETGSAIRRAIDGDQPECLRVLLDWCSSTLGERDALRQILEPTDFMPDSEKEELAALNRGERVYSRRTPYGRRNQESGSSPLQSACENGKLKCVEVLLEYGADPNVCQPGVTNSNAHGRGTRDTALTIAIQNWSPPEFTDARNRRGWRPFGAPQPTAEEEARDEAERRQQQLEISNMRLAIIRLLLERGHADVNGWDAKRGVQNRNPLSAAIEQATPELVKILVEEYGADLYGSYDHGSVTYRYEPLAQQWCYYLSPDLRRQAIHFAANGTRGGPPRSLETLGMILDYTGNAVVNATDAIGQTPLFYAVRDGRNNRMLVNFCSLLLERGAYIDAKRLGDGAQAVHCINLGDWTYSKPRDKAVDIVRLLLAHGCDLNARTDAPAYDTPLHFFAARSNRQLIEVMVAAGADINAKNGNNVTPLMAAFLVPEPEAYDAINDAPINFGGAGCRIRNLISLIDHAHAKFDQGAHGVEDTTAFLPGCDPMDVYALAEASGRAAAVRFMKRRREQLETKKPSAKNGRR